MRNIDQESYSVLRFGGATQVRACAELCVSSGRMRTLEAQFRVMRPGGGQGRPRFARDAAHVSAILQAGGFSVLGR